MDEYKGKYFESEIDKYTQLIENGINIKENLTRLKNILEQYFFCMKNIKFEPLDCLTLRENEIYELVKEGYSNGEIAKHLWISIHTVKKHIQIIKHKLEVKDRNKLILL